MSAAKTQPTIAQEKEAAPMTRLSIAREHAMKCNQELETIDTQRAATMQAAAEVNERIAHLTDPLEIVEAQIRYDRLQANIDALTVQWTEKRGLCVKARDEIDSVESLSKRMAAEKAEATSLVAQMEKAPRLAEIMEELRVIQNEMPYPSSANVRDAADKLFTVGVAYRVARGTKISANLAAVRDWRVTLWTL